MENIVCSIESVTDRVNITDVTNEELDLIRILRIVGLERVAHPVLFFLIAAEDADFSDIRGEKVLKNCGAKAPGAAGNDEGFIFE